MINETPLPVVITVYVDRTYSFVTKTPPKYFSLKGSSPTIYDWGDGLTNYIRAVVYGETENDQAQNHVRYLLASRCTRNWQRYF